MTKEEEQRLVVHAGHEICIADYKPGEPKTDNDLAEGRFCLECLDCGEVLLGERVMVGISKAQSVS